MAVDDSCMFVICQQDVVCWRTDSRSNTLGHHDHGQGENVAVCSVLTHYTTGCKVKLFRAVSDKDWANVHSSRSFWSSHRGKEANFSCARRGAVSNSLALSVFKRWRQNSAATPLLRASSAEASSANRARSSQWDVVSNKPTSNECNCHNHTYSRTKGRTTLHQ